MSDGRDLSPREAAERWLDRRRPDVRDSTLSTLWYRLKLFVEYCEREGFDSIRDIDGWDIDEYQLHRHQNAKPLTLNKELGTLRQWLEYCVSIGVVDEAVPTAVEIPDVDPADRSDDTMLPPERGEALLSWYRDSPQRASRPHALLEIFWTVGCRSGALRSLDVRDFNADEQWLRFEHRPETGTELKKGRRGERYVGLLDEPTAVLAEFLDRERMDISDRYGRSPLIPSEAGRPATSTIRDWCYLATVPCKHGPCPHENDPASCEYLSYVTASGCPSSRSPHQVRTGSITWQLSRGVPIEVIADRVNSSPDTIEEHYDKEDPRRELEVRRRGHLDALSLDDDTRTHE
ncbi:MULTISPECIES: tyrosine-type recombinase/integrase [Salinibaculum]|uniref:tyrosine-type recombinase/integrase n=1 Tax=Salinibaculum TaxID=2732368 RepID=UPI0030CB518C